MKSNKSHYEFIIEIITTDFKTFAVTKFHFTMYVFRTKICFYFETTAKIKWVIPP